MQIAFEALITSFIDQNVGLSKDFLGNLLSSQLRNNLLKTLKENKFQEAGIGNNSKLLRDKLIRSDKIYWLDRSNNDIHENSFFDVMDQFVTYLNETCYTRISGYEFHYAFYDTGSFYKRHLDQFKNDKNRSFSLIMYLNEDWQESDGGALCIYHAGFSQMIFPNNGSCVFFKSDELEHEVLLNHRPRLSITGWLKSN